eukprot:3954033-Amphidinium_carterae.1
MAARTLRMSRMSYVNWRSSTIRGPFLAALSVCCPCGAHWSRAHHGQCFSPLSRRSSALADWYLSPVVQS